MILAPYTAALRLAWRRKSADRLAGRRSAHDLAAPEPPPAFVFGPPTVLTSLRAALAHHPGAHPIQESSHLWRAVDARTDAVNLYDDRDGMLLMEARHASARARERFARLFYRSLPAGAVLLEFTADNAFRIGFLEALAPAARFVNIVADGLASARHIESLAAAPPVRIAGRPPLNSWWGAYDARWALLARQGAAAGYFPTEVGLLESNLQRGAYEWLVGLAESDRWRFKLGPRFADLLTVDLAARPGPTLTALCSHLGLAADAGWLADAAIPRIEPGEGEPLALPPKMAAAFNAQQERFGFPARARSA